MPEPIKVDFRKKRRPAEVSPRPAPRGQSAHSGQKAVNWRALPKFLLFVLAMGLMFAALNWAMRTVGLPG